MYESQLRVKYNNGYGCNRYVKYSPSFCLSSYNAKDDSTVGCLWVDWRFLRSTIVFFKAAECSSQVASRSFLDGLDIGSKAFTLPGGIEQSRLPDDKITNGILFLINKIGHNTWSSMQIVGSLIYAAAQ
jgi:hypothetical protein